MSSENTRYIYVRANISFLATNWYIHDYIQITFNHVQFTTWSHNKCENTLSKDCRSAAGRHYVSVRLLLFFWEENGCSVKLQ